MRIALVGYGKMGKAIEDICKQHNDVVSNIITSSNASELQNVSINNTDVAIEFTHPEAAFNNVSTLLKNKVAVVCGTTGWNNLLPKANELAIQNNTAFIQASNFSIGVNLFFAFTQQLAATFKNFPQYKPQLHEVHHTQKKDFPSGTAITTAEKIIEANNYYNQWTTEPNETANKLFITHERKNDVVGFHSVQFKSPIDQITLSHNAESRLGFAHGAWQAAHFIAGKQGVFTMQQVLGL
jgi:4-hydroxy-tetrahydrodipicolinate reductase